MTIAVIGILCLVMAARARWASEGSHRSVTPTSSVEVPSRESRRRSDVKRSGSCAAAIRETIETIRAECQRNADGDWDRWSAQLAALRHDLSAKIRAGKAHNPTATEYFEGAFAGPGRKGQFPALRVGPRSLPASCRRAGISRSVPERATRGRRGALARATGIDVIFVPVPKMTEIYPEYFTDHCPDDRIIAPHIRQAMLELLEADVEVVDLCYAFQAGTG